MPDREKVRAAHAAATTKYPIQRSFLIRPSDDWDNRTIVVSFNEDGSVTWNVDEFKEHEIKSLDKFFGPLDPTEGSDG